MKEKNSNKLNIKLDEIKDPKFLLGLNYKQLADLSSLIRNDILENTAKYGGHLSSNLGVVELTIALHRSFDFLKDKLLFDVGHQCYTHKILTGRSLKGLRSENGISGFIKCSESPYDIFEAGHSSTSLSAAQGFAIARDLNKEKYDVVALIGDASIVSGLALEALNNIAPNNNKIIIVLNDNGMSISKPTGGINKLFTKISSAAGYNNFKVKYKNSLSKTKFGKRIFAFTSKIKNWLKSKLIKPNIFIDMGFSYIGPVDGHNIKAIEKALARAKNTTKSVVVHVCTTKGKGYKPAENDQTGYWHGVTPFEIETGIPKNMHEGYASWSHIYSDITIREMEANEKLFLISPATIKGAGLDEAFEKFKNRTLDVGISEEHAATLASGLCLNSYHPIISIYSTFLQRSYDEIIHDLARINANVTFLIERSGLIGEDGETHQGIYDVAFLRTIPNTTITMASTINEANKLYKLSLDNNGPFFIRIPRTITKLDENYKDEEILLNSWLHLKKDNSKVAVVGVGPLLRELETLINEEKIDCNIFNALFLNKIDNLALNKLLEMETIFIYDPYSTELGLVDFLRSELFKNGFKGRLFSRCVENEFVTKATKNAQLEKYQLLPSQMVAFIKQNII